MQERNEQLDKKKKKGVKKSTPRIIGPYIDKDTLPVLSKHKIPLWAIDEQWLTVHGEGLEHLWTDSEAMSDAEARLSPTADRVDIPRDPTTASKAVLDDRQSIAPSQFTDNTFSQVSSPTNDGNSSTDDDNPPEWDPYFSDHEMDLIIKNDLVTLRPAHSGSDDWMEEYDKQCYREETPASESQYY